MPSTIRRVAQRNIAHDKVNTPVGSIVVVASESGVSRVVFPLAQAQTSATFDGVQRDAGHDVVKHAIQELEEYFAGDRQDFDVRFDLHGTAFQLEAWKSLATVPFGSTATYAQQAALIGRPRAVRAVGGANRVNPVAIFLPCHRIIGSNGALTGFAGGLEVKKWLLEHEQNICAQSL